MVRLAYLITDAREWDKLRIRRMTPEAQENMLVHLYDAIQGSKEETAASRKRWEGVHANYRTTIKRKDDQIAQIKATMEVYREKYESMQERLMDRYYETIPDSEPPRKMRTGRGPTMGHARDDSEDRLATFNNARADAEEEEELFDQMDALTLRQKLSDEEMLHTDTKLELQCMVEKCNNLIEEANKRDDEEGMTRDMLFVREVIPDGTRETIEGGLVAPDGTWISGIVHEEFKNLQERYILSNQPENKIDPRDFEYARDDDLSKN